MSTALQTLRNQYQGSLPLTILENIVNTKKELNVALQEFKKQKEDFDKNKDDTVNSLMSEKYEEFISKNKNVCTIGEVTQCSHFIQLKVNVRIYLQFCLVEYLFK